MLAAIALVGLFRGGFWAVTTDVFSQIDEAQHYDYVRSLSDGQGPPVVGTDRLAQETRALAKRSEANWWRSAARSDRVDDDRWGSSGESYEGVQGPLYYALLAPVHRVARAWWGPLTTLFVLRWATVLLALLTIPAVYALGRQTFPRLPAVSLLAPAVLVFVPGFNANLGALSNDALMVPLSAAATAAFVWAARRGLPWRAGLVCGALLGAAALTKSTAIGLVPFIGLGALAVGLRRDSWVALARWVGAVVLAGTAVFGPWVVWNLTTYGAPSATEEVDAITGVQQAAVTVSLSGARQHVRNGLNAFWDHQLTSALPTRFSVVVFAVAAAVVAAGAIVALGKRRREEATVILWLGSALPLVLAWMLFLIFVVFEGRSGVVGRHLYPAAGLLAVALAAAAVTVAGRVLAPLVLAAVLVPLAVNGASRTQHYLDYTYTWGVVDGRAPVILQTYADTTLLGAVVEARAPCAIDAVGVLLPAPAVPPPALRSLDGAEEYPLVATFRQFTATEAVYRVPARKSVALALPSSTPLLASRGDSNPRLAAGPDDPAALVYCERRGTNGVDERFGQLFGSAHPAWASRGLIHGWATVVRGLLYAAMAVWIGVSAWFSRVTPAGEPAPRPEDAEPA